MNNINNRIEKAVSCYSEGFNCSQAVFSTYSPLLGLDEENALKIAGAFGGGIARMGETCGAVTGAFMLIGLKHGAYKVGHEEDKEKTYELVRNFVKDFEAMFGSVKCRDLLGYDISNPEGRQIVKDNNLFKKNCPEYVEHSAKLIEQLFNF